MHRLYIIGFRYFKRSWCAALFNVTGVSDVTLVLFECSFVWRFISGHTKYLHLHLAAYNAH